MGQILETVVSRCTIAWAGAAGKLMMTAVRSDAATIARLFRITVVMGWSHPRGGRGWPPRPVSGRIGAPGSGHPRSVVGACITSWSRPLLCDQTAPVQVTPAPTHGRTTTHTLGRLEAR